MRFDVYCDESRPDLLGSQTPCAQFMVIGGLWLREECRAEFKADIHSLRDKHKVGGEFKWQKVSPSRLPFYIDLIDWFISKGDDLRFRCIAVDREKLNLNLYHDGDQELGFYKFYYQMLHHWILDFNEYSMFCDFKSNRVGTRLEELRRCLSYANLSSTVLNVQAIRSRESVLLQVADVLTGIAASRLNNSVEVGTSKWSLANHLEQAMGKPVQATFRSENKFNVFIIDLRGGW